MSRFRRALAGAAMAMAMAGGGLLATAAGAAPAHAATPAPASRTFSFTAVPAAQAAGGSSPKFQCGETCDPGDGGNPPPPTITCTISVDPPYETSSGTTLVFDSDTVCTGSVARITMTQNVVHTPGGTLTDSANVPNKSIALIDRRVPCVTAPDSWTVNSSATITPPAGWVIISGHNPIVASTPMPVSFMNCNNTTGGGGGGGCATGTPSVPAQPAARQPKVVTC
jgi:hypothetical protein